MNTEKQVVSAPRYPAIAAQFLLDSDVAFFNHGSFGACPRPVFETYQHWQRELERQPVDFIQRRRPGLINEARATLGDFVGAQADNVVFVPNATYGVNIVTRSIDLQPGDEVLTTDHEYGAINNSWRFNCEKRQAHYISQPLPLPFDDPAQIVDALWEGVTERTRVIALSHITSPTALILPVEDICRRAQEEGIITVVDGAHALGQVDLDLEAMGVTFYTGNAHKWLCAPKGSAFLYAASDWQSVLEPLVVSHGWSRGDSGSTFLDYFSWTGTMDPAAYLSVPAAIQFQRDNDWPAVRASCHELASEIRDRIQAITELPHISTGQHPWYAQMFTAPLPAQSAPNLRERLWRDYKIEVPITGHHDQSLIRVSVQAYTTDEQVERLIGALTEIL